MKIGSNTIKILTLSIKILTLKFFHQINRDFRLSLIGGKKDGWGEKLKGSYVTPTHFTFYINSKNFFLFLSFLFLSSVPNKDLMLQNCKRLYLQERYTVGSIKVIHEYVNIGPQARGYRIEYKLV